MPDGSINPTMFGGLEGSAVKIELSDDALGVGRAVEGIARQVRKGPEGLLDRADRFYELKQTFFPVHTAKRDAKAMTVVAQAIRGAAETLGLASPDGIAATRMIVADYARRYRNIDTTIALAMPMIAEEAEPDAIQDDWLGFAFEYIGGVSEELVQELWARLLAQEANRPGRISKRAVSKLALVDARSTYQLRKILSGAITLYIQTPRPNRSKAGMPLSGMPLYKVGRFVFPLLIEMLDWSGPKPSDDLIRQLDHGHDGPSGRTRTRSLTEEGFLRAVTEEQVREGYLNAKNWRGWESGQRPLGVRVGLGRIYGCDARDFIELIRRYSNNGATAQMLQLTGLAEALLDPRITSMQPIVESDRISESPHTTNQVERFLVEELKLQIAPAHSSIAENPGYLDRDAAADQLDLQFYFDDY